MMFEEIIKRVLYLIAFDAIATNIYKLLKKYANYESTIHNRRVIFLCCFVAVIFDEQIGEGKAAVGAALHTAGEACVEMAQALVDTMTTCWYAHVPPMMDQLNDHWKHIEYPVILVARFIVIYGLAMIAARRFIQVEVYEICTSGYCVTGVFVLHCTPLSTMQTHWQAFIQLVQALVSSVDSSVMAFNVAGVYCGRTVIFTAIAECIFFWVIPRCYVAWLATKGDNWTARQHQAAEIYQHVSNPYLTAACNFTAFSAFIFSEKHPEFPANMMTYCQAFVDTVQALVNNVMAFNVAGLYWHSIVSVSVVYSLMMLAFFCIMTWLPMKGDNWTALQQQAAEFYEILSNPYMAAAIHFMVFSAVILSDMYSEFPIIMMTHCQAAIAMTTHSMTQVASYSAKPVYWSLQWDLALTDQEASFWNETEPSTTNLTMPLTLETALSPPEQLYSPFENIELIQSWMTPSYFEEEQGVALFVLHQLWFPGPREEKPLEPEDNVANADCCQQDDLTCRIKAIAIDYVSELTPYLFDETPNDDSKEADSEYAEDAPFDFARFVLSFEHTIFRIHEIAEPVVPKKNVFLKPAEFSGLTPAATESARCDGRFSHYHRCMQSSFINMSLLPVRSVSTSDTGVYSANASEDESSAPINSSLTQAPSNTKSLPALSDATESIPTDGLDPTLAQASTDLAPSLSQELSVPTDGQSPADGVGESLPPPHVQDAPTSEADLLSQKVAATDPVPKRVRVCSNNDSLWDVASDALRLIQTNVQENLKSDTKRMPMLRFFSKYISTSA